jgi:hypothetical protein
LIHVPNPAVHSTMSTGVRFVPGFPPMVPLIPEIDFISVNLSIFIVYDGRRGVNLVKHM